MCTKVLVQTDPSFQGLPTGCACEIFLIAVALLVRAKSSLVHKRHATNAANKWSLTSMKTHVTSQAGSKGKGLQTYGSTRELSHRYEPGGAR